MPREISLAPIPARLTPASRTRTRVLVTLGWIVAAGSSTARAVDKVYPDQGPVASGKIVSLSPSQVIIEVRGKNQSYQLNEVQKVTFDDEPTGLERARDHFINEQFDQALEEIKKVDANAIDNPVIRQEYEFYRWYCEGKLGMAGEGDKQAAINGLLELARANSNTHHLFDLGEMLGQLHLAVGKPDDAVKYFSVLLRAADADTQAKGEYRLAQVELAQGKNTEAKTRLAQLVNSQSASAEMTRLKSLAEVGLAVCDHREGNSEKALKKLDSMVDKYDSTDQELFARIYNAQGACYKELGRTVDALLSYLKTDLLFFSEADAHAEALYHLKSLWTDYGNPSKSADAGKRLVAQYASSTWANQP